MALDEISTLSRAQVDQLRRSFTGEIVGPEDAGYDDARRVWCAVFDRRPALIVRPTSAQEVTTAIRFGREHSLEIAVRGGGHSGLGHSTSEGGLVIDLRAKNDVSIDPERRVARTGGGALLGQLDVAAQAHGLVCPVGVVSHTGVGGLTLGGGIGRLQRNFGLTIDNLRSVEVVTADGRIVRASEDEEPELFWGIRGAGPNFGVVTDFELGLHPFDGVLTRQARIYPASQAHELWALFRDYATSAPDSVSAIFNIGRAEPAADYPASVAGQPIVMIGTNHSGGPDALERDLGPILRGPEPVTVIGGSQSYLEIQGSGDLAMDWGSRSFILSAFIGDLGPDVLDAFMDAIARAPGEGSISCTMFGGAVGRVADDAMAYTGRTAPFDVSADMFWSDPAVDDSAIAWIRETMAIAERDFLPGRYGNANSDGGPEMTRAIYGNAKLERLRVLKRTWDPENVFHLNHNIAP